VTTATTELTTARLSALLGSPGAPTVVDVRTPAEFDTGHVPGSYNVPLDILKARRDDVVAHIHAEVALVCRSGQRAAQAEEVLRQGGFTDGRVLRGAFLDWERQGFAVDRGRERWDLERQVRLVAGSVVLSSVVGSVVVPKLKWLAAAIGGGLTFAAVSNTCAMANVLARLPYNAGAQRDPEYFINQLTG
jgi:rhodanese-related sulfurtransferase